MSWAWWFGCSKREWQLSSAEADARASALFLFFMIGGPARVIAGIFRGTLGDMPAGPPALLQAADKIRDSGVIATLCNSKMPISSSSEASGFPASAGSAATEISHKRLECDEDKARFEAKLGKLAKATKQK